MVVHYSQDGMITPPKGVRAGGPALGSQVWPAAAAGGRDHYLPSIVGEQTVGPDERLISLSAGGGGYGHPHQRPPQAVLTDVVEGYISPQRARAVYGVALAGDASKVETLRVDEAVTATLRA